VVDGRWTAANRVNPGSDIETDFFVAHSIDERQRLRREMSITNLKCEINQRSRMVF
jgi:hypothetical protein